MALRVHEVAHEYFHNLQAHAANRPVTDTGPVWLYEGAAEYEANRFVAAYYQVDMANVDREKINQTRGVANPLETDETLQGAEAEDIETPYNLGFAAVEFLANSYGEDTVLQKFWDDERGGVGWQDAFKVTFGLSVDDFYAKFEAYRAAKFPPYCANDATAGFAVKLAHQLAPGEMTFQDQPWSSPPNVPYVFCASGSSFAFLTNDDKKRAIVLPTGASGWSWCGGDCIAVFMKPRNGQASFSFDLTLDDGRRAVATFEHSDSTTVETPAP